jgi:hypothetical protein
VITKELVELIRGSADVLKPLCGKFKHAPQEIGDWVEPEPYALAWRSKLDELATMLELQGFPVTEKQLHHIKSMLGVFGGNGTLDDLFFNADKYEAESKAVNEKLRERIGFLRNVFGEGPNYT